MCSEVTSRQIGRVSSPRINWLGEVEGKLWVCAKDVNFQGIDAQTGQVAWKAKNLARDELNLVEKINHMACVFRSPNEAFVVSGYNRLLFYDIRAQKKAVGDHAVTLDEEGMCTSLCLISPNVLAIGNSLGSIGIFNVAGGFKITRRVNDHMAGITDLCRGTDRESFLSGKIISWFGPNGFPLDFRGRKMGFQKTLFEPAIDQSGLGGRRGCEGTQKGQKEGSV
jgi:hypothetical protein